MLKRPKNVSKMSILYLIKQNIYINKISSKVYFTLLYKEQLKYLKTTHSYHLVDASPWPFMASLAGFMLTSGLILFTNKFTGGLNLLLTGLLLIFYVMFT
jgi:hypothetical protein